MGNLPGRLSPADMERDLTLGPVQRLVGREEAAR
jgi:hypothetical protein